MVTAGNTEQLVGHLRRARADGLTETELVEAITHHHTFYASWPRTMTAIPFSRRALTEDWAPPPSTD